MANLGFPNSRGLECGAKEECYSRLAIAYHRGVKHLKLQIQTSIARPEFSDVS